MHEPVVVVAPEPEDIAPPVAQRHLRVGVVAADGVKDREDGGLHVRPVGEVEPPVSPDRCRDGDERGQVLEDPVLTVAGRDGEREPHHAEDRQAHEGDARAHRVLDPGFLEPEPVASGGDADASDEHDRQRQQRGERRRDVDEADEYIGSDHEVELVERRSGSTRRDADLALEERLHRVADPVPSPGGGRAAARGLRSRRASPMRTSPFHAPTAASPPPRYRRRRLPRSRARSCDRPGCAAPGRCDRRRWGWRAARIAPAPTRD